VNYQKTEIGRRVLEPGLGKGLITSQGETWRQHRRIMSPAFDHLSIAAYTPIMTGAAGELLAEWGKLRAILLATLWQRYRRQLAPNQSNRRV
jgi:cytochrome P450